MAEISILLHADAMTVNGSTIGENLAGARTFHADVIRPLDKALAATGGTVILRGTLAPDGAVLKTSAADPRLLTHTGRAVVFDSLQEMETRVAGEDFDVDENSVLVLRNAGPLGGPGMPEWGMLPIPPKLFKQGVRDMLRISDARMSGTAYGTCVLHVSPESFIGGPLALVREGDLIRLDVPARRLDLLVDDAELARRKAEWKPPAPKALRGYLSLYEQKVSQADKGCDFDFLS